MKKCLHCGGPLTSNGNGTYTCQYCWASFSESDFAPAPAAAPAGAAKSGGDGASVFDKNINGILEITSKFSTCTSAGSGLLITKDGYAITNTHVVTNNAVPCSNITVKIAGENVGARIIALGDNQGGLGSGVDLALLKLDRVPYKATVIELGDFDKVRIGQRVYVIGNSLGYGTCITNGIVSDKLRNVNGKMLLMTDCAVNGGNSGGPMFDENGVTIGVIVSGITAAEGMNFAIPISTVKDFIMTAGRGRVII